MYFTCIREISDAAQKAYFAVYRRIEVLFEDGTPVSSDVEIMRCMDMVRHLLELEDLRTGHPQLIDRVHGEGEVKGSDMKGMIASLLRRMMKESGDIISNSVSALMSKSVQLDSDSLAVNPSTSSRLDKMRSLAVLAEKSDHRAVKELADTFSEVVYLFGAQLLSLRGTITDLVHNLADSLCSKRYIDCLLPLQQLKVLEVFDLSPDIHALEVMSVAHSLFLDSITDDCEDARLQIDENTPGCAEVFRDTIKRVFEVISSPAFSRDVKLDRLHTAVNCLTAQVATSCKRAEVEFQLSYRNHDVELFSKLKTKASFIDSLRQDTFVSQATTESHHSLFNTAKNALDSYFRQAFKAINAITTDEKHSSRTATPSLKSLLLSIHDASALEGGLQDVCGSELKHLIVDMSAIVKALNDSVVGDSSLTYMESERLKAICCKRYSVALLQETIDLDCSDRVTELSELSMSIAMSIQSCDSSIIGAATEGTELALKIIALFIRVPSHHFPSIFFHVGVAQINTLLACSASQAHSKTLMRNVRDALFFLANIDHLGFSSLLSDGQKADMVSVNAYFTSVGDRITLLLTHAKLKYHQFVEHITGDSANTFEEDAALEIRQCLAFLKSFESYMTQSSCPGLDVVKGSVEEALARSINATLSLLTDLSSHAEEYEASCVSGPSILTALYVKFQLCDMLSVLDEFLPITDSNLKFISTAYKFKSVISKISTSTRQKIPNHDFDGVLSDLKNFTRENPLVAAELRSLLQEVFTALTSLLKRTKSTAESFSLGTTSHEATVTLFNDLREISEKSNMFATYLADDQFDEYAKMKDLDKGINATMNLICGDCLSRMDDLKVTLGKSKFYEIEDLLAATARTLPILERLSRDIEVANQVRWSVSSEVCQMPHRSTYVYLKSHCPLTANKNDFSLKS